MKAGELRNILTIKHWLADINTKSNTQNGRRKLKKDQKK